mgnify:FL=1
MSCWHHDNEGEDIINKSVERLEETILTLECWLKFIASQNQSIRSKIKVTYPHALSRASFQLGEFCLCHDWLR